MRVSLRPLTVALLLLSSVALAASGRVTLKYQGPLGEGLEKLASQSGVNLIVTGDFHQPVQLMFNDLPADEALQIIARTNHLHLEHQGDVYTLSSEPAGAAQPKANPQGPAQPPAPTSGMGVPAAPPGPGNLNVPAPPSAPGVPSPPPVPEVPRPPHLRHSDRDLVGTGSVTVAEGQVVDDAVTYGGTLTVNGTVQGDAVAFGGNVHLGPHAKVAGETVAFGGSVVREPGAEVGGQQFSLGGRNVGSVIAEGISHGVVNVDHPRVHHAHPMSSLAFFLMEFVLCFGMGFLFLMFIPNPMKQIEGEVRRDALACGATGLLGALALSLLTFLLAVTILGLLVVPVLLLAVVVALCMGYTALANEIGMKLPVMRGKKTQATVLALGTILMLLVARIPWAGPILIGLLGLVGLGAIIRTRFGTRTRGFPEPV